MAKNIEHEMESFRGPFEAPELYLTRLLGP